MLYNLNQLMCILIFAPFANYKWPILLKRKRVEEEHVDTQV